MEKSLNDLEEKLKVAFKDTDILVDEVTYEEKGKYYFLTVVLDKVGGIDLETIVDATKIVNEIVDENFVTDDNYILDVISKERG